MTSLIEPGLRLPAQSPPINRSAFSLQPAAPDGSSVQASGHVQPSQSVCDNMTGMARSLCYSAVYGVSV